MTICIKISLVLLIMLSANPVKAHVASLKLVDNGNSKYKIVIPAKHSAAEMEAANVLQHFVEAVSGAVLPIIKDSRARGSFEVLIGNTNRLAPAVFKNADELVIKVSARTLILNGGKSKGVLYAAYRFAEQFLGCRKFAADVTYTPVMKSIELPSTLLVRHKPDFEYREVYYPDSKDQSYLDWHGLTRLDDVWGLWVHTFDKLVPARQYFDEHPEYYGLVDGQRKPSQLCLSNPGVLEILIQNLKKRMVDEPTMKYWSVSQNDDLGFCQCDRCSAVDKIEGGPQGSIVRFVNKVAARFPDQVISTLAYTYSERAPLVTKPIKNVQIMLSSIDCNRSKPIATDPRAANFRKNLKDWSRITSNLFVWDYAVQFTNYVSPFPNLSILQSNLQFFRLNKVQGVFSQGSGETQAEFSALRGYLLAKLSWDTDADVEKLTHDFLAGYYGEAAPFVQQYISLLDKELKAADQRLNIYGNPVSVHNTYLRPAMLDQYGRLFDKAEEVTLGDPIRIQHVRAARLPVEFAVLQQSRFYGIEKHGAFVKNEEGEWTGKSSTKAKVMFFVQNAKENGITELSEGGYSPEDYAREWEGIFEVGPKIHMALNAEVKAIIPYSDEYPNKGIRTLTDGSRGYLDYQYNWLGWYGTDMEVVVDLGMERPVSQISTGFLEDQRHWAFLPLNVYYSFSLDGKAFTDFHLVQGDPLYENYDKSVKEYSFELPANFKSRFVKVRAKSMITPPQWRYYQGRKTWLFADEIMIR